MSEWYKEKTLPFKLADIGENNAAFELEKILPKEGEKYNYVSEFFDDYIDLINDCQIVALFSKKDMGKSFVGYLWMRDYFKQNIGNMVYGRLQEKEKQSARSELFSIMDKMAMKPYFDRGYGKDYIFFEGSDYSCRLVNISSYQSLRGAIGEDNHFIWFDEINAYAFPPNFDGSFINILSTLGRKNNMKVFLSGNNETATNNPVLNALQLKFDWNFNGIQICTRVIDGVKICGIQLGYEAFNNGNVSIAEKIAKNNPAVYNTFYLGLSNTNEGCRIVNLKEDYKIEEPLMYWVEDYDIFSINKAKINDSINKIKKECYLIKHEPYNYDDKKHFNPIIKMYTVSNTSDIHFKRSILLKNPEEAANLLKPFILAEKNELLYYADFLSHDTFNALFTAYHPSRIEQDEVYEDDRKRK